MRKILKQLEDWFFGLPESAAIALVSCAAIWVIINGLQFTAGLSNAPKTHSMCRIEVFFPGYQVGLWMGTRFNGEGPIDAR